MINAERAPWRVLVVDDEENLNWSLVNSLRKEGYQAEGALTGETAQQYLLQERYDCVISDVKMPGMDGFALMQWLRRHDAQTRIIMMTAFGSPTAREEALRGGVIAYLEKPFDLYDLKDKLRQLATAEPADDEESSNARSESYDLLEVAQVLNLTRRDIALRVQRAEQSGVLRFLRGELVWAEAGDLRGEEAFLALCAPRGGRMQPEAWAGGAERNVSLPLSRLIYLALARRDGRTPPITFTSGPLLMAPATGPATGTETAPSDAPIAVDAPAETQPSEPSEPAEPIEPIEPTETSADAAASETPTPMTDMVSAESGASDDGIDRIADTLAALATTLPSPCGVALLRADGGVIAQRWVGLPEAPANMYTHLAGAAQAAARALLMADLGAVEELRISTEEHIILLRRVARVDGAALLMALLPASADIASATAALRASAAGLV